MRWYEWLFDGLGTALISFISSFISYKAAVKKMSNQNQIAGDDARQNQRMIIDDTSLKTDVRTSIYQKQKSGNKSEQIQYGEIKNGK